MTQETYEYLTESHGISQEICRHCNKRIVEIYQADDWASCYYCWCTECTPKIDPPPED